MVALLIFNVIMVLVGAGVATRILPPRVYTGLIEALHGTVGITTPTQEKMWMIALVWIGSVIILVDGLIFLMVFLIHRIN